MTPEEKIKGLKRTYESQIVSWLLVMRDPSKKDEKKYFESAIDKKLERIECLNTVLKCFE